VRRVLGIVSVLVLAGIVVAALWPGEKRHDLVIASDQARFIFPGLEVRLAGRPIGTVESAKPTRQGTARVRIGIDDSAWPLPVGTRAAYRWAGTIAFTNRYVELSPPLRTTLGTLADGATISGADFTDGVEVDDVARLFDGKGRAALRATLDKAGPALANGAPELRRALDRAPSAVDQARAVVEDLGADPAALDTLVSSADAVVHAARSANPDVAHLIDGLRATFAATAGRAGALQATLRQAPATLTEVRTTLARATGTLQRADAMLTRLAPGVVQLRRTTAPLNDVLSRVVAVAPQARQTLATLRVAAPSLRSFLATATVVVPKAGETARQANPQLDCIRRYAPEIAGFATTWNGFLSRGDGTDKYARANAAFYPYPEGSGLTSAQVARLFPFLHYAFPRPPGEIANQPWFNEKCGVGRDSVDPNKDPEAVR
jgi:ABC-type transporter Mla subunit MlaD